MNIYIDKTNREGSTRSGIKKRVVQTRVQAPKGRTRVWTTRVLILDEYIPLEVGLAFIRSLHRPIYLHPAKVSCVKYFVVGSNDSLNMMQPLGDVITPHFLFWSRGDNALF